MSFAKGFGIHDHLVLLIHHRHPVIALDDAMAGFHLGTVVIGDITLDRQPAGTDLVVVAYQPGGELLRLCLYALRAATAPAYSQR